MMKDLKYDNLMAMFAPCGMNCAVCHKHCHTTKPRKPCGGCTTESKGKPGHCRKCKIKNCVQTKGVSHCYLCGEFPCKLIKNLERNYKRYDESLIENSETVKEKGISYFTEAHIRKHTCTECGGIVSLHDKVCTECGASSKRDER